MQTVDDIIIERTLETLNKAKEIALHGLRLAMADVEMEFNALIEKTEKRRRRG